MSSGYYEFCVIGSLIKDPEIKQSKAGKEYATITIGTTKSIKKGDKWENDKEYHNFVCSGRTVDIVKRLSKLDLVRATSNNISNSISGDKIYTTYMLNSINTISKAANNNFAKNDDTDDIPTDVPF